jgi:predicted RNase H-like HicB family nuclease
MRYAIVVEKGETSYGAYVPDLPGCVAVAETEAEVRTLIREAIALHLEGLRDAGAPIPQPVSTLDYVDTGNAGKGADPAVTPLAPHPR